MFGSGDGGGSPTMIIPSGTRIEVDPYGQLSIRTPGNLVIQNSGSYDTLESSSGSIRIEPGIDVEAVTVRCAEDCYVKGNLTAWRLIARRLHLDGEAMAHVVLQETERLDVEGEARLVGNFRDRRELYDLFSRFARQIRNLPLGSGAGSEAAAEGGRPVQLAADVEPVSDDVAVLPDELFLARILLEREVERAAYGPSSRRILGEMLRLLGAGEVETLQHTYRSLFSRIETPSDDLERAQMLVTSFFAERQPEESSNDR